MADPITFRPTVEDTENLAILTADGASPTHAIRHALEIAAHSKRQEDLRADAARLAANPEYARSAKNWTSSVRGDVYRLKRPRSAQGHEQQGERYAVVIQANAYEHLSTWLVAPTTTKSFGSMIHPTIELLGQDVRVLVEQTTAVDPQRLGDFAGRLDPDELVEINLALRAVLDIE
jgi:mRNA interferase MazF